MRVCYVENCFGIFAILLFNSFICALVVLILDANTQNRPDRVYFFSLILISMIIYGIILYTILYYRHKRKLKTRKYLQSLFFSTGSIGSNYLNNDYDLIDDDEFESDFQRATNTLPASLGLRDHSQLIIPA